MNTVTIEKSPHLPFHVCILTDIIFNKFTFYSHHYFKSISKLCAPMRERNGNKMGTLTCQNSRLFLDIVHKWKVTKVTGESNLLFMLQAQV